MTDNADPAVASPLAGVQIIEIASFVAVPLAGMTLAQLGAEVIRVDPIAGPADYHRWPLADAGASIYWTGLNKGIRSVAVDVRAPEGQDLITELIAAAGVMITNVVGRQWHSYESLTSVRPDLIHVEITGRADGTTGVDYTVNAGVGFPLVTGPAEHGGPINHALPAWDVACGLYTALGVSAALRHRDRTGEGSRISVALENVALATAGALGFLTEPMVTGRERARLGNAIYGQYGQTFTSADGVDFMVVALTNRHFRDLTELTGTAKAVAALSDALGVDFADEGTRFRYRDVLGGLFADWFHRHDAAAIEAALTASSVLWERYRSFGEVAAGPRVTANPLFAVIDQPGVGAYHAAGSPLAIDGAHPPAAAAPALGADTAAVLSGLLGLSDERIDRLVRDGIAGTDRGQ